MPHADHSRRSASVQRWCDLALYAFFGTLTVVGITVLFPAHPASIPLAFWIALALSSTLLPFVLARWSRGADWVTWFGLRHWRSYPPCWMAGLLGGVVVVAWSMIDRDLLDSVARLQSPESVVVGLAPAIALCIGIAVVGMLTARRHRIHVHASQNQPSAPLAVDPCVLLDNSESLYSWLATDTEIDDPHKDAFGHAAVARRIAHRLSEPLPDGSLAATIALVGDLGSGKSSICKLTEYFLRADDRLGSHVEIVQISLWAYEDPGGAVEGILGKAIAAISAHVDVLALAGIPQEYAATIASVGGPFAGIGPTFVSRNDPASLLDRLSQVLTAIDIDIILWIEDLERYAGETPGVVSLDLATRLAPVRGLLYLLHRTPGLRVVIASRSIYEGFDVEKLARFVEQTPSVSPDAAWKVIRQFLLCTLEGTPATIDDPKHKGRDSLLFGLSSQEHSTLLFYGVDPRHPPIHLAIARLLNTPRTLKTALRETREVWNLIPGEIDFEDVFCTSALKASRPTVYSWCDTHRSFLTTGTVSSVNPQASKEAHASLLAELNALLGEGQTRERADATRSLLAHLFPAVFPEKQSHRDWRPQRVGNPSAVDYWRRFVTRTPIPWDTSDQRVIRAIRAWPDTNRELLGLALDVRTLGSVEQFAPLVGRLDMCELLDGISMHLQHSRPSSSDSDPHPAIVAMRRMMNERPPPPAEVERYLVRALGRLVQGNLVAVLSMLSYFCSEADGVAPLLSVEGHSRVLKATSSLLAGAFSPHGTGDLVAELRGRHLYFLSWLCHKVFKADMAGGSPGEDWARFAQALLFAATLAPGVVVPAVAALVMKQSQRLTTPDPYSDEREPAIVNEWVFDEDRARRLFPYETLRSVLISVLSIDGLDVEAAGVVQAVRRHLTTNSPLGE